MEVHHNRQLLVALQKELEQLEKQERRMEKISGKTAEAFAVDMLLLKFVQGLPVVGVLGGAGNPIYYRRIMKYVQLKYRKRYLLNKISEQ